MENDEYRAERQKSKRDLISRQAAIDYLLDALYDLDEADYVDKEFIEEELKRVPSVQPKQKTGQWIYDCERTMHDGWIYHQYHCSLCEFQMIGGIHNFCPNCGAKMESEEN